MDDIYDVTALTPLKAARESGYIDWASQPSLFKHYPAFLYRYSYESCEALSSVENTRFISHESIIGSKPYYQLNVPSAGNLHPIELYVQIRGIKGVLSGVYHIDAGAKEMVLVQEIEQDGIEPLVGLEHKFEGFIYIVSCVAFRSRWKYGTRAFRYCYLDAGHQIGAIEAVVSVEDEHNTTILSDFDTTILNRYMGFTDEEQSCAVIAVGKEKSSEVIRLKTPLMRVAPTDYYEEQSDLAGFMAQQQKCFSGSVLRSLHVDKKVIQARRSARFFVKNGMEKSSFEYFMHRLSNPPKPLRCDLVVLDDRFVKSGIYHEAKLLKAGDYGEQISKLLVDQKFLKDASFIIIMSSDSFGPNQLMSAGLYAHELYLEAVGKDCGFTGIGAFYDKKLQTFLSIEQPILYVCALAKEKIARR